MWSLAVWPPYDKSNSDMEVDRVQKTPPIKVRRLHTDIRQTNRDKEMERQRDRDRGEILFLKKKISCFLCQLVFLFTVLHS